MKKNLKIERSKSAFKIKLKSLLIDNELNLNSENANKNINSLIKS